MRKCKYCCREIAEGKDYCSICGINITKVKNELTKEERKVVYFCRAMHTIGFLNIILGCFSVLGFLIVFFLGKRTILPSEKLLFSGTLIFVLLLIYFGFSLLRYKKWCFYASMVLYGYGLISSLIASRWLGVLISILFLYYVINPISKKILFRQIVKNE